ncbi:MAG: periplasmic heavy metal sensor [Gemmatimonadota bacterium]|nr:periplasmic heavy metal sensor [Gemmatimonadota bacterium]
MTRVSRFALAFTCSASALLLAAPVAAQGNPDDLFGRHLFPPELVMQNQQSIGLSPKQRTDMTQAIQEVQSRVVDVQWRMQEEAQKLAALLEKTSPNQTDVLAQVDRVLDVEREIKRAHMAMLVRIKNLLTAEQQTMLRSLR